MTHTQPGTRHTQVTVRQLPPQATRQSGPLSAPPRPAPSGGRTGEILGQDLSGRALSVLEHAASLHPSPAHRRREGGKARKEAGARTHASAADAGGSSSRGGPTASRPAPPWQAVQAAQGGEHRGGDRGRWQERGRSAGGGERLGEGQGKGETYAQQLLAGEVELFGTTSPLALQ
jgi:hypothetical protein